MDVYTVVVTVLANEPQTPKAVRTRFMYDDAREDAVRLLAKFAPDSPVREINPTYFSAELTATSFVEARIYRGKVT
jgi:hypothetical protein